MRSVPRHARFSKCNRQGLQIPRDASERTLWLHNRTTNINLNPSALRRLPGTQLLIPPCSDLLTRNPMADPQSISPFPIALILNPNMIPPYPHAPHRIRWTPYKDSVPGPPICPASTSSASARAIWHDTTTGIDAISHTLRPKLRHCLP
jgi:hypothetical protein